jgi:para-nitrobenzyl esterase
MIGSPVAKGLFQRAIAQSGSYMRNWMPTQAQADNFSAGMLNYLGYPNIAAFRALSTTKMDGVFAGLAKQGINVGFGPNVDGNVVPVLANVGTNLNDTPILTGMTADEASSSVPGYGTATTASLFSTISRNFGGFANEFWSVYNASTDAAAGVSPMALMRDTGLGSMHIWGQRRLATTRQPIYAYLWMHVEPGPNSSLYRAFHSSEMPSVFGTLDAAANRSFTSVDRRISR